MCKKKFFQLKRKDINYRPEFWVSDTNPWALNQINTNSWLLKEIFTDLLQLIAKVTALFYLPRYHIPACSLTICSFRRRGRRVCCKESVVSGMNKYRKKKCKRSHGKNNRNPGLFFFFNFIKQFSVVSMLLAVYIINTEK